MDLFACEKPFLVGIKGVGMTALALIARDLGLEVRGTDLDEEYQTDRLLKQAGVEMGTGFGVDVFDGDEDYLVATGAHGGMTNPLVGAALERGLPVDSYAEALGKIAARYETTVAVTGSDGKTTTTAMIATILDRIGMEPGFVIGAPGVTGLGEGRPGRLGATGFFVTEADDYVACPETDRRPKFDYLSAKVGVMTNLEYDHPDVYDSRSDMAAVYRRWAETIPPDGVLVINGDSEGLRMMVEGGLACGVKTFGWRSGNDYQLADFRVRDGESLTEVVGRGELRLRVPGRFNVMNAVAAVAAGEFLGLDFEVLAAGLELFRGAARRFEYRGSWHGVPVYDDYAHHPVEIAATVAACREWFDDRRIRLVFQPHTYSRTAALMEEFVESLRTADEILLTEIFASQREEKSDTISSAVMADKIGEKAKFFDDFDAVIEYLESTVREGDVILTMGAGDVYQVADRLIKER